MKANGSKRGIRTAVALAALVAVAVPAAASPPGPQVAPEPVTAIASAGRVLAVLSSARQVRSNIRSHVVVWDAARVAEAPFVDRVVTWDHPDSASCEPEPEGPWDAVVDIVVDAARLPARAGLVAEHLLGAFAKITPRVASAIF